MTTTLRATPYSLWFRPMGRLFMVEIEDLGGERGRLEATLVISRSNSYLGTCQAFAPRIPEMRACLREAVHYRYLWPWLDQVYPEASSTWQNATKSGVIYVVYSLYTIYN